MNIMVDADILVDVLKRRHPYDVSARRLLFIGYLGEVTLWTSVSQFGDAFYVLTEGGRPSLIEEAKRQMAKLRQGVRVCSLSEDDADAALASTWDDAEAAMVYQAALKVKADAIVTRERDRFSKSSIRVLGCDELFGFLERTQGLAFEEIPR